MGDHEAIVLYDSKGRPAVILPGGTTVVPKIKLAYPTLRENETALFSCPDGDLIEHNLSTGKVTNLTKYKEIADLK